MRASSGFRYLLLAISVFLACEIGACAEDPNSVDWLTEYATARRQGIKEDRLVLLFVTSENCGYCIKMRDETLSDKTIIADLRQKFVPAKLKLTMNDELAQQLRVSIYPTTMIISPQGQILDYARGYLTPDELHQRMNDALVEQTSLASNR